MLITVILPFIAISSHMIFYEDFWSALGVFWGFFSGYKCWSSLAPFLVQESWMLFELLIFSHNGFQKTKGYIGEVGQSSWLWLRARCSVTSRGCQNEALGNHDLAVPLIPHIETSMWIWNELRRVRPRLSLRELWITCGKCRDERRKTTGQDEQHFQRLASVETACWKSLKMVDNHYRVTMFHAQLHSESFVLMWSTE